LVVSIISLAIFILAATVDVALVGGFDNEVGVEAAHPWLQGLYFWIFPYFNMLGALGIEIEELYSPNGIVFFEVFIVSIGSFLLSRLHRGLSAAIQDAAVFASTIVVVFIGMIWWASPSLLASKATQFSDSWRLGGVHLVSNLFVLTVSAFILVALATKKILREAPEANLFEQGPPAGQPEYEQA